MEFWSKILDDAKEHYKLVFQLAGISEYCFLPSDEEGWSIAFVSGTSEQRGKALNISTGIYTQMKEELLNKGVQVQNVPRYELYYGIAPEKIHQLIVSYNKEKENDHDIER